MSPHAIDLSAGLVPKSTPKIDLSAGLIPKETAPAPKEEPGFLEKAWSFVNEPIGQHFSGYNQETQKLERLQEGPHSMAEADEMSAHPVKTALKSYAAGVEERLSDLANPLLLVTAATPVIKAAEEAIPGVSTVTKTASKVAPVAFGAQGAYQTGKSISDPNLSTDQRIRLFLSGLGQAGLGTAHVGPGVKEVVAEHGPKATRVIGQEIAGIRPHVAEELVTKTMEKNEAEKTRTADKNEAEAKRIADKNEANRKQYEKDLAEAEKKNEAARAEHEEAVKEAEELNHSAQEAETRKGILARQIKEQGARLVNRVQDLRAKAKENLNARYNDIAKKTAGKSVPLEDVTGAAEEAKGTLQGSSENVKVFEDILKRAKSAKAANDLQEKTALDSFGTSYEKLTPAQKVGIDSYVSDAMKSKGEEEPKEVTFNDLRGYSSEIAKQLRSGGGNGDVRFALGKLRNHLDQMAQKLAHESGQGANLKLTNAAYKDFKETFDEPEGPSHSGSPLAQTLNAEDPAYAIKPLTNEETSRRVRNMLARFDPSDKGGAAKLYDNFLKDKREYDEIGKQEKAKPVKPPKEVKLPEAPEEIQPKVLTPEITKLGPEDIAKANEKEYKQAIRTFRRRGVFYGAVLPWIRVIYDMKGLNFGKAAASAASAAVTSAAAMLSMTKLADVMERPRVIKFITEPTATQLESLDRLPPEQRKEMAQGLQTMETYAKQKGRTVSPKLTAFIVANNIAQQQYPHTAVNDQGHRIGSHDGQAWFDHETGAPIQ